MENICGIEKYISPVPLLIDTEIKPCESSSDESTLPLKNGDLRSNLLEKLKQIQETCEMLGKIIYS